MTIVHIFSLTSVGGSRDKGEAGNGCGGCDARMELVLESECETRLSPRHQRYLLPRRGGQGQCDAWLLCPSSREHLPLVWTDPSRGQGGCGWMRACGVWMEEGAGVHGGVGGDGRTAVPT